MFDEMSCCNNAIRKQFYDQIHPGISIACAGHMKVNSESDLFALPQITGVHNKKQGTLFNLYCRPYFNFFA